jgi:hypothetical protein
MNGVLFCHWVEGAMTETTQSKVTWLHWLGLGAFALFLVFAWFFGAALQLAIPAYLPFYAYVLYALTCCLPFSPILFSGRFCRTKIMLHAVFLAAIGLLWFFPISSRQPFLKDLYSVQAGMSVAQVNGIMGKYKKGTGWPANPLNAGTLPSAQVHSLAKNQDLKTIGR